MEDGGDMGHSINDDLRMMGETGDDQESSGANGLHELFSSTAAAPMVIHASDVPGGVNNTDGSGAAVEAAAANAVSAPKDNASSNVKAMDKLKPTLSSYVGTLFLHQRCALHVINLIVKSGLQRFKPWLDDFRTAISFLNASNQRIVAYKSYCVAMGVRPRRFGLDMDYPRKPGDAELLTPTHWYVAAKLLEFLELFYDATVLLSGVYYPTSPLIMHTMLDIAKHLHTYESWNKAERKQNWGMIYADDQVCVAGSSRNDVSHSAQIWLRCSSASRIGSWVMPECSTMWRTKKWKLHMRITAYENLFLDEPDTKAEPKALTHNNLDIGKKAAKNLLELDPFDDSAYVLLSNLYATNARWVDVDNLRNRMKTIKLNKRPACSWLKLKNEVSTFGIGDQSHMHTQQIYAKLDEILLKLKEVGYVADTSSALHDTDEEQKEQNLWNHSEKLTLAYGLLVVPECSTIRIFKNLRVCADCHLVFKLIFGDLV
ncbi:hypothetical protein U9M48_000966 [Paspalum notatum var. saurae]|uniref:DYW domain-containing protein n=1 Tax=Paspalum notatum var. saurae TaxID=547442 RepID=A0AAQ3PMH6_PASNO